MSFGTKGCWVLGWNENGGKILVWQCGWLYSFFLSPKIFRGGNISGCFLPSVILVQGGKYPFQIHFPRKRKRIIGEEEERENSSPKADNAQIPSIFERENCVQFRASNMDAWFFVYFLRDISISISRQNLDDHTGIFFFGRFFLHLCEKRKNPSFVATRP